MGKLQRNFSGEPKFTFGADLEWPMWRHPESHRYLQINNFTLWTRYYFKPRENRYRGIYVLGNLNAARYGIGWDAKGWEGEGLGISLGTGYKWVFGRFFIDLGAAFGFFYSGFDPYVYGFDEREWYYYDYTGDPDDFSPRNKRLTWFGPTRVYISVGVDLFNRKTKDRR